MIFNTFQFLWLFPIIFLLYWGAVLLRRREHARTRLANALLLTISYALVTWWMPSAALFLLAVTAVTYIFARLIERHNARGDKKYLVWAGVLLAILPLLWFKYYNFLNDNISALLSPLGLHPSMPRMNLVIPLGISFFTFQAVGYLCDVYYRRIDAERNWWHYMLFVGFFPQIASGPISKASELLPQIKADRRLRADEVTQGAKWFLWGLFLKVVLADRLGITVDTVLPNYAHYNGSTLAYASALYSLQLYGDFAGYSLMAIGVGRMLGFNLVNNFRRPYLAATVTDFWRRWHISLTRWLTTYVYIPLGGSRCSKPRHYLNILATFLVSGIWHGANWTFIAWGGLHGLLQLGEKATRLDKAANRYFRPLRILLTFLLVTLAWVLFRMPTLADGWHVIAKIFTDPGGPVSTSATNTDIFLTLSAILCVLIVEWCEEYRPGLTLLNHRRRIVRWATYIALVCAILLCGVLDAGSFIYVSF